MSDITAVVLTLGEDTTARALDSVRRQSYPARETVVVSDTTPFHAALNLGASRVRTKFFVQVDADMILDPGCFEALRDCLGDHVGIVAGHLRDPLIGRVSSIKLFRTECFGRSLFGDSISPDTDFAAAIMKDGWSLIYALKFEGISPVLWHTFGEHRPDYTPQYTFSKYLLEGRRYRYRKDLGGLLWHLGRLGKSKHPAAGVAQVALAQGIFIEEESDLLSRPSGHPDFSLLERYMSSRKRRRLSPLAASLMGMCPPLTAFEKSYRLGIRLRRADAYADFRRCLEGLAACGLRLFWPAYIGLCRGSFVEEFSARKFENDRRKLRDLMGGQPRPALFREALRSWPGKILRRRISG